MFDKTIIPKSYETGTQSPLDVKGYFKDESDMLDTSNYRPLSWFKNMDCLNVSTGIKYVWKESIDGIIDGGYTYPDNIESFGIVYSNKTYNFVEVKVTKSLESFTVRGTSIGKVKDGEVMPEHESSDERWKYIGTKQILPTFTSPSINLSWALVNPNEIFEVGTVKNIQIVPEFTQNDGGDVTQCIIRQDNVEIMDKNHISSTIVPVKFGVAPVRFQAIIKHSAGTEPKDDNLEPPNSIPNTIGASTLYSTYIYYYGRYNRWTYLGDQNTSPTTSAAVRSLNTAILLSLTNTDSFSTAIPEGVQEFSFYTVRGKSISVIDEGNLNNDVTDSFVRTDVVIKDAGGVDVDYEKNTIFLGLGGFLSDTIFNITIS